ncbi:protein FAM13A-like isoform X1 [Danio rerio]|uniref:Protein FAM13A-like isoform X1 n=1 Tax=Danio rerio TaxID=7955 RepID=A0AC58GXI8_DANRE
MAVLSVCQVETLNSVFGVPLIHLRKSGQMRQGIPLALRHMVEFLEKHGVTICGLFRVSGRVKSCQDLKKSFNNGEYPEFDIEDIHPVASLLKLFLRELPGGLIPEPQRHQLLKGFLESKGDEQHQAMRAILNTLPEEHFNLLSYLMFFLSRVAGESQQNLMTTTNLSIVFGPTIFYVPLSPTMVEEQELYNALTKHLLENLTHLLPNIYPPVSSSNTAEDEYCSYEDVVQQVPLTGSRSKLPKIGRLGLLKKRLRSFWRLFCSCTYSNGTESEETSEEMKGQL